IRSLVPCCATRLHDGRSSLKENTAMDRRASGVIVSVLTILLCQPASAQLKTKTLGGPPPDPSKPRFGINTSATPDGRGMKIVDVSSGMAAQIAGIQAGDLLLRVGEQETNDVASFQKAVASM